jgi:hypothetical protein
VHNHGSSKSLKKQEAFLTLELLAAPHVRIFTIFHPGVFTIMHPPFS